jgi:hypothetical protein
VNGSLAILAAADPSSFELGKFELGVFGTVVAGLILFCIKLYSDHKDREEADEKTTLKTALDNANSRLETETSERQSAIAEEASARRVKDESLGDDISEIREEMCHDYGKRNLPRPTFKRRTRGED